MGWCQCFDIALATKARMEKDSEFVAEPSQLLNANNGHVYGDMSYKREMRLYCRGRQTAKHKILQQCYTIGRIGWTNLDRYELMIHSFCYFVPYRLCSLFDASPLHSLFL